MGDKRTDPGQYYPGGKVVSQHGVAPPQIIVQWSDVQGKPQIAPLPDRYRDSDVKEKVNEIASKFATALAVALVGWTAFAGLVVQKAQKVQIWNDEEIVTNAYLTGENASGSVRTLPKYLWIADLDDSYPEDAAWYYRQPQDYGHCSSVRDGNTYSRNLDWKFNSMAEVIIRMSAGQGRFASLGVSNVGTNLTEEIIASGAPTRYVKALPGHTVDGINENGVVCSVNVVDGPITGWSGGDIHPLGAVRWVLDHATSALDAATNLAARIAFPQGWSQNFHWMVADADETYIVENGDYRKVTGRVVMTNFPLINRVDGTGLERYNILMSPTANITNAWWTLAYIPATSPRRYTDLETTDESVISQIFGAWATGGRESHRGQTYGGNGWWQTVHTTVYDIENRIMRISVQEKDDWYVLALPSGGKVKSVNGQTGDVTITAEGIGALTTNLVGKTIVTGTNTHIRMEAGTKITGTDDSTITLGGGTLTVPENLSVTVRGNRTLGTWGITNAYTKTETDAKIEQATPQDYETVRVNAQAGAAHAARTDNPHGVTATQIGAVTPGQLDLKRDLTDNKCYVNGFSAWVLTGSDAPSGDYEAFFRNAHLVIAVGGADYAISRDTVSEDAVLVDDFRVPDGPRWLTITATRSRVVFINETFVTPSFVTNAIVEFAPVPGNYAAVSNAAMNAVQPWQISETNAVFSTAVLSVATGISTNDWAVIASVADWASVIPGGVPTGAGTLGAVLAALAAAVLALKKKTSLLKSDGTAENDFATDLLGKQVAITAIDARIKTNAESAAEPTNAVTLNDNAPKTVTVATVESPATPSLAVTFGTARNGGLRICELYILNGTADTDLTFDSAVHFVSTGDSFPACEAGINYFVFAEVAANLWKVTRETLKSITTPTPVAAA